VLGSKRKFHVYLVLWGPTLLGCFGERWGVYISVHSLPLVKLEEAV
jgi:hypothetical protein